MRVCLVGGSGFIGTALAGRLAAAGVEFGIVDKRASAAFPGAGRIADICDQAALMAAVRGEVLVHLAAEHRDDVLPLSRYDAVNVGGTRNLCAVAEAQGIRTIIFTSTVAVYGFAPAGTDEAGAVAPFNAYGRTKFAAEQVLRAWQSAGSGRTLVIVRPTVVFGPGNRGNVYNLLRQIGSGAFVMVGRGENRKSVAYVQNVAAFLQHCTGFGPGVHLYNYVDQPDLSMNELVGHVRQTLKGRRGVGLRLPGGLGMALGHLADGVAKVTGRRLPVSAIRVRKFMATTSFASAAHGVPGFQAPFTMAEGLEATLQRDFLHPDPQATEFWSE